LFEKAKYSYEVKAEESGFVTGVDTESYGVASLLLGAGRNTKEDIIDFTAGIILHKKTGDKVEQGERIATLYSSKENVFPASAKKLLSATKIGKTAPADEPLILDVVE
jgi:pyrimidine-nucleoside phosphorylase